MNTISHKISNKTTFKLIPSLPGFLSRPNQNDSKIYTQNDAQGSFSFPRKSPTCHLDSPCLVKIHTHDTGVCPSKTAKSRKCAQTKAHNSPCACLDTQHKVHSNAYERMALAFHTTHAHKHVCMASRPLTCERTQAHAH